ncbi:hypothetical protein RDWZM_008231 [Blomia tropicalis]|uniref:Uncharacterized protein n=1 Tax=Blomia tropicalis TaxID=40697 RepID=A0A9Q0RJT3_BLOTA|nr:hypothetical protein RDWZM_008231 [Blomia tropicalis]
MAIMERNRLVISATIRHMDRLVVRPIHPKMDIRRHLPPMVRQWKEPHRTMLMVHSVHMERVNMTHITRNKPPIAVDDHRSL